MTFLKADGSEITTNDNFRDYKIGMQWAWNHNPDNGSWSLFDNPGYLRLYTSGTASSPKQARNSLSQRIFDYKDGAPSMGTVCLDISGMKDGDVAGISVFQDPYGYIAITKQGNAWKLTQAIVGDENENYDEAITSLSKVIKMDPSYRDGRALLRLGQAYMGKGDNENAAKYLQQVIDNYGDSQYAEEAQENLDTISGSSSDSDSGDSSDTTQE